MIRPPLDMKIDAPINREFDEWWKALGPKYDAEDRADDPDGQWEIQVRWWAWEAWRYARRMMVYGKIS